jgi:hypothetical protein
VRGTWGHLLVTRRVFLDKVIHATRGWPPALANDLFNDALGVLSPRHDHKMTIHRGYYNVVRSDGGPVKCSCHIDYDAHILKATEALHAPALSELVRRRSNQTPKDAFSPINALRRLPLQSDVPKTLNGRRERLRTWSAMVEMLPIIQFRYPDHRFDVSQLLVGVADKIIWQLTPELTISAARFSMDALSAKGIYLQVRRLMMPYLAIAAGCSDQQVLRLEFLVRAFHPVAVGMECSASRKALAKEGLAIEIMCGDGNKKVAWAVEERVSISELDCQLWK